MRAAVALARDDGERIRSRTDQSSLFSTLSARCSVRSASVRAIQISTRSRCVASTAIALCVASAPNSLRQPSTNCNRCNGSVGFEPIDAISRRADSRCNPGERDATCRPHSHARGRGRVNQALILVTQNGVELYLSICTCNHSKDLYAASFVHNRNSLLIARRGGPGPRTRVNIASVKDVEAD
jgi:hypothetical protein